MKLPTKIYVKVIINNMKNSPFNYFVSRITKLESNEKNVFYSYKKKMRWISYLYEFWMAQHGGKALLRFRNSFISIIGHFRKLLESFSKTWFAYWFCCVTNIYLGIWFNWIICTKRVIYISCMENVSNWADIKFCCCCDTSNERHSSSKVWHSISPEKFKNPECGVNLEEDNWARIVKYD